MCDAFFVQYVALCVYVCLMCGVQRKFLFGSNFSPSLILLRLRKDPGTRYSKGTQQRFGVIHHHICRDVGGGTARFSMLQLLCLLRCDSLCNNVYTTLTKKNVFNDARHGKTHSPSLILGQIQKAKSFSDKNLQRLRRCLLQHCN